jgi:hypothetical protein
MWMALTLLGWSLTGAALLRWVPRGSIAEFFAAVTTLTPLFGVMLIAMGAAI